MLLNTKARYIPSPDKLLWQQKNCDGCIQGFVGQICRKVVETKTSEKWQQTAFEYAQALHKFQLQKK